MVSEERIYQLAYQAGIRQDSFGLPVIDNKEMLIKLIRLVEAEPKEKKKKNEST